MAQLTDDCFAFGGPLMSVETAEAEIARRIEPVVGAERQPLAACLGRVLAEDIAANRSVPPHDNSAVDGYAVRYADLDPSGETVLRVVGRAAAGHPVEWISEKGVAVRIFTGAAMPDGFDTVMMQEDCVRRGEEEVAIRPGIRKGGNRRLAGEDVMAGAVVARAGSRLRPSEIGLAASVGLEQLPVRKRLRVAVLSTGDELVEPGRAGDPGQVYDANRFVIQTLVGGLGAEVTDLGILPDREETIRKALDEAAAGHDAVLTSGGMSTGEEDHVRRVLEESGKLHFWRLAIKPGRPVGLGQLGRVPVVGLPGNPVAAMICFLAVARPLLLRLMGATVKQPETFPVTAGFDYKKKADRREFVRVSLRVDEDGRPIAEKFPRDGAGILSSVAGSDGLAILPEDLLRLGPGDVVRFLPFSTIGF